MKTFFWMQPWNREPEGDFGKIKDCFERVNVSRQPVFPRAKSWCTALALCSSSESATANGQRG